MPKKMSDLAMNSHVQLGIMPKLSIRAYTQVEHYAQFENMPK